MDLVSIIIGAVFLAIGIIPFVISSNRRSKNEKKMLNSLKEMAKQQNCNISQHESCGDFIIGICLDKNFVFFSKQKNEVIVSQSVDLSEVLTCQSTRLTRTVEKNKEINEIIEHLELAFAPKNKSNEVIRLELYDEQINQQLSGELQMVEKWSKLITARL